jgi:curved DNA-binding protein
MKYKDYYATLGLERGATEDAIKKAYRRLARKYHPDVSKEANAEEKFKEVAEAYQTLKDADKRKAYDQLGAHAAGQEFEPPPEWQQQWRPGGAPGARGQRPGGAGAGGPSSGADSSFSSEGFSTEGFEGLDLSELLDRLRGGRGGGTGGARMAMPGEDYEIAVPITIADAYSGTEIDLDLNMPEYDAQGQLRRVPHAFKARIPKGATDGQRLRVPGKGGKGFNGGRNGDLYLNIRLQPHALYRVNGHDLYLDLPLAPWEAVLGTSVEVPTPGGTVRLKVPAGTQAGQQLRLPRRGLPRPRGEAGDLFAVVSIVVPSVVGAAQRALYQQLADTSAFAPRAHFTDAQVTEEDSHAG